MGKLTNQYQVVAKYPVYEMAFRADFRRSLVTQIINRIRAGQCVSLVGVNGVGLNTLFKFLGWNRQVKEAYLKNEPYEYLFVNVDFIEVPAITEGSLYRLVIIRTNEKAQDLALSACFSETTRNLFIKALDTNDPFILTESLRAMLKDLIMAKNRRVIYLFHNFDRIAAVSTAFLNNLMNLYIQFRSHLLFVFGLHQSPERLRSGKEATEFDKIFYNTVYFQPSAATDLETALNLHLFSKGLSASAEQAKILFEYTGGIGAFTIIFAKNVTVSDLASNQSFRKACELASNLPEIKAQCELILKNLNEPERQALKTLAAEMPAENFKEALPYLNNLSLITFKDSRWKISSQWLKIYLLKQEKEENENLVVDKEKGQVLMNSRSIANLSSQEFRILSFLYDNEGRVCSKDEIASAAWDTVSTEGVSDEAIDQAISRLRKKIEADPAAPRFIQTIRGRGFVLTRSPKQTL